MLSGETILVLALAALVYFTPSIVAFRRDHSSCFAILVINMFLGWTFLGWVVALAWALIGFRPQQLGNGGQHG